MTYRFTFIILIFFQFSCNKVNIDTGVISENAMVVTAREEASKIGIEILKKGGNAFDAMVATELALAVAYPYAGNIGGGGFMVFRKNNGEVGSLDYREKAPIGATRDMYLDKNNNVIEGLSTIGGLAVGVPGTIAGVFEVYEKYGTLSIEEIFQPVIDLALKGVVVTKKQDARLKQYYSEINHNKTFWNGTKNVQYDKSSLWEKVWNEKDTIKYSALAKTLKRIMLNGKKEFYEGKTASELVKFVQKNGGIITLEDLKSYEPRWRKPVVFEYDDLKIISMSPPSSGGICLEQIMKMINPYDLQKYGHNQVDYIKLLVEAERRAYADRSYYLGDPDFNEIPYKEITSNEYLSSRMKDFSFSTPTLSKDLNPGNINIIESSETTHYSILDQFGNSVSVTTTLNAAYGSKLYSDELGFFLNNEMDDFSSKPGVPNMYGLIGSKINRIEPGKRMLSSMTPTIVEKNNDLYMVLGTPGGSTIITSVLQTILNVHEFKMTMQQAVNAPRFHHQWLPDVILFETTGFDKKITDKVASDGYKTHFDSSKITSKVEGILILDNGKIEGGADKRGDDKAVGF
ncbi:gamma-glutamyltransferase [Flavobacteriaceae bacterium]|nr:gamma-glutamyltransferase [Flavobacteriaceae bacterium]RZP01025.1 MAG: gamma-glutamyltransferase [Flavobacteriales bacterium]